MTFAATILAGGKGARFGGLNKALLRLGNITLVERVAERLVPQVNITGINANRDLDEFQLPIVADGIGGDLGPLDGILGALNFAKYHDCTHALTVPVDTPFLPADFAQVLYKNAGKGIAIASTFGRVHGTCGLWPVTHLARLKSFILSARTLKVMDYLQQEGFNEVPFEGDNPDPFLNINTPEDLAAAGRWL